MDLAGTVLLFVGLSVMTSLADRACELPGCKCFKLHGTSRDFVLECKVDTETHEHIRNLNYSVTIKLVTVMCTTDQKDPTTFLHTIQSDTNLAEQLVLENCETSLAAILNITKFPVLRKLTLRNVVLSDTDVSDVLVSRPLLTELEIIRSPGLRVQHVCLLTQLSKLLVSQSNVTEIDSHLCKDNIYPNLASLDVSHNALESIPSWVSNAQNLTELYLQFNQLKAIPSGTFKDVQHLKYLDLSSNLLTALPDQMLPHQTSLVHLNLSYTYLTTLPETILENAIHLEYLDLSFNNIRYLPSSVFGSLQNLKTLNLSSNVLPFLLRSHLSKLENLLYLDVGTNQLRNIPPVSACKSLNVLDLRENNIKYILGSSLRGLSNLTGLGLRHNLIQSVPLQAIAVSNKLQVLDLSHNNISYIDYNSEVNVSKDLSVSDSLSVFGSVEIFLLNNNRLKNIYRLSRYFTGLKSLVLAHNEITYLGETDLPNTIQVFDLAANNLKAMDYFMFRDFPDLKAVGLNGNYPQLTTLPANMIYIDNRINPKPIFFIGQNLFVCDCHMSYLKSFSENDQSLSFRNYKANLPNFVDIDDVYCLTHVYPSTMRKLADTPEDEFICMSEGSLCEQFCPCCLSSTFEKCYCLHECPLGCICSQGGSNFKGYYNYMTYCNNATITISPSEIPSPTTILHLDGSNMTELKTDSFSHLVDLKELYLNDSQLRHISPGAFKGLKHLTHLYLDQNYIENLTPELWTGLGNLTHLFLQNNMIASLTTGTFKSLKLLKHLDVSHNLLTSMSVDDLPILPSSAFILMNNNPLSCSCSHMRQTVPFLTVYGPNIVHQQNLKCIMSNSTTDLTDGYWRWDEINETSLDVVLIRDFDMDVCNESVTTYNETRIESLTFLEDNRYAVTLSVVCVSLFIAILTVILVYTKRREIQALMFVKYGVRVRGGHTADLDETGRTYDAFVSYSSHDERLVVHELAPRLEEGLGERHGKRHYKLCLHYRDFPVGDSIADTIIESIEASKRTIMLLSDNFLSSEWCRYEFQTAHHHVLKERSHRLILVLMHDLDDRKLDPDLKVHLKEGHFLRYDDPWFWEKLYFALPDVEVDKTTKPKEEKKRKPSVNFRKESLDNFENGKLEFHF